MPSVTGVIVKGYGVASGESGNDQRFPDGTIKLQIPHFREHGFDFDAYFAGDWVCGTLNVSITPHTLRILKADYFLRGIKWTDIFPPENFFLVGLTLRFDGKNYRGLLYEPDPATKPDHFQPPMHIEVICNRVPGIKTGDKVELDFDQAKIEIK